MDINDFKNNMVLIDIREFDERPGPFCMSYGFEMDRMISSVDRVGLVNRPCVRRNKAGSIEIITGYRRILALKALNRAAVPCVEITDPALSDRDLLVLNICDNICTRDFNPIEKGMILERLQMYFSREEIYETYMGIIGISSRKETDLLLKIQAFDDSAKAIIAAGSLSIKTIEALTEIEDTSRNEILRWIATLRLNTNQQILFMEYLSDISIREEKGITDLLNEEGLMGILTEEGQNMPQKAKRIIDLLKARRFPCLTENERVFHGHVSGLGLPKGVRIKHSQFFEGPDYLLEISFRDGLDLEETIEAISKTKGLSDIRAPWKE